jgi:hypothetical protein
MGLVVALKSMKFSLHCCQFLGVAERLLWSGQIGKLCDSNQPVEVSRPEIGPVFTRQAPVDTLLTFALRNWLPVSSHLAAVSPSS